ncbi:MAG: PP2C family protein-serine/threonine phosphatase [Pyrinomonadaceae bacterium]
MMTLEQFRIDTAAISDRGLSEKRPQNEDSYLELRDSNFYCVADGVGGAQAGDVASQMATEILGEAFVHLNEGGDAEVRMKAAIEQANSAIFQMSHELPQLSTMATTIVGLHIGGDTATIAHVGDSRLYRVDASGQLYKETQDHSVVEEELRAGRLTPEQAINHPSRNVISRALGAEERVEIDQKTIMIEPGTSFLLCTDGVTRHMSDDELRIILVGEDDPFVICQKIKDACYSRGAEDNLTAVVVKVWAHGHELEEPTMAAVRPPLVDSSMLEVERAGLDISEPLTSPETEIDKELDDELNKKFPQSKKKLSALETIEQAQNEPHSPPSVPLAVKPVTHKTSDAKSPTPPKSISDKDVRTIRIDEEKTGTFGRLLTLLPWILLLAVVGLCAYYYYFYLQNNQPTSQTTSSPDIAMTTYETARRKADASPTQYIAVASRQPKDAADYYLLGRAYYLTGEFGSSLHNLKKAKDLSETGVQDSNSEVLRNDIDILLQVVQERTKGSDETSTDENSNSVTPNSNS